MQKSLYTPILKHSDASILRRTILDYFINTQELYESLFKLLANEAAYYERADPLRHPLIFYYGHTATFYINKLIQAGLIKQRINSHFESIFAVGVDEMSWDDLNEANYNWPSLDELKCYRQQVHQCVKDVIQQSPLGEEIQWTDPFWTVIMGIEHERIHLETSSVLIRQLPLPFVNAHPDWEHCTDIFALPHKNSLIAVPAQSIILGKAWDEALYGWDNEYGQKTFDFLAFKAGKYLVSNHEFKEFIDANGYNNESFWSEEGWKWRLFRDAQLPIFWRFGENQFYLRCLTDEIPMPWSWPVEVNFHEAKAFCQWKSQQLQQPIRLPSEAEWMYLRNQCEFNDINESERKSNINLAHYASSCPTHQFKQGDFFDVVGNVWQWTESTITGFPGFKVHPHYDDFSLPTFDTQHNLIKGGSWISTGNEITQHARYAFRRHFFQHAGFRYVLSAAPVINEENAYEKDEIVAQYIEFHYGDIYFGVENYPKKCAEICLELFKDFKNENLKALDLGCSVGRTSFELAKYFSTVIGIDYSSRFIRIASELMSGRNVKYKLPTEGDLYEIKDFTLKKLDYEINTRRVQFYQGDACNLNDIYAGFDLVFLGNLIDRLYDPNKTLALIKNRVKPGGYLVLSSPYTWLNEYTDKDKWLGGFKKNGKNQSTLEGLKKALLPHFQLIGAEQIPFVLRETARKFQHSIAELTIWKRAKDHT